MINNCIKYSFDILSISGRYGGHGRSQNSGKLPTGELKTVIDFFRFNHFKNASDGSNFTTKLYILTGSRIRPQPFVLTTGSISIRFPLLLMVWLQPPVCHTSDSCKRLHFYTHIATGSLLPEIKSTSIYG